MEAGTGQRGAFPRPPWAQGPASYWGREAGGAVPGCTLRLRAVDKQGLEEEDVLKLGCGEFEVAELSQAGSSVVWEKAWGSFISICSTEFWDTQNRGEALEVSVRSRWYVYREKCRKADWWAKGLTGCPADLRGWAMAQGGLGGL